MKQLIMSALVSIAAFAAAAQAQKITVTVENEIPPPSTQVRRVALVVQNHAHGAGIPFMALTDALTAKLAGCGLQVVNPYNSVGVNQNRDARGEKTPQASAMDLARQLHADGAITASVIEFLDSSIGVPPVLRQYSIRITLNLAEATTDAVVCGETIKVKSPKYTNNQVAQNRLEYLGDLMYAAADECAERLKKNANYREWAQKPMAPPPPSPPPPDEPWLTLSDVDGVMQKLIDDMRANPVFRSNYDTAQKAVDRAPLVIVGGLVDLTGGKSPTADIANLLGAASQNVRMTLLNTRLFDAKDDVLVTTITKRIIENGNSPLEDGELMSALKQHGSPDFFMVGDLRHFSEKTRHSYRFRLALHNLHTGKIVWEGVETIIKNVEVSK